MLDEDRLKPALRAERYLNRELSALAFNERVLALACSHSLPLLERVRFLAIVASNLDEFFMVRVAGLMHQLELGELRSIDGRTAAETLAELRPGIVSLVGDQDRLWRDELRPALAEEGIAVVGTSALNGRERAELRRRFDEEIFPILTPLAVGPGQPFPYVSALSLSLALLVTHPDTHGPRLARVKVPESLPRFVAVGERGQLLPIEDVVSEYVQLLYPGSEISARAVFRVTRDADFEISDEADDLLEAVESKLKRRRFGEVVRLEITASADEELTRLVQAGLGIGEPETYRTETLVDRSELSELASFDRPELKFEPWEPVTQPRLRIPVERFLPTVHERDVLVQHPYDSFTTSVGAFLAAAAKDAQVLALKTTVYRTNEQSPLGPALAAAVEAGKQAVCLVELKARFDEQHNIEWSRGLERAGVHVVYGFPDLKIHAKMTLVVRRDEDGVHRYAHIGTGNYHALTAGLYEDFGLFTADEEIAADVADLFNYLTGLGDPPAFRKLVVAPWELRNRILAEVGRVAGAAADGKRASIKLKLNALTDQAIIDALYDASNAGARIEIVVRGVCCLRPGVPGMSETITVRSVLGRFLEHSRYYIFKADGLTSILMGSGDLMSRNLDRRIEVLTPVEDPGARRELKSAFKTLMRDSDHCWALAPDGRWHPHTESGEQFSSQRALMLRALRRSESDGQPEHEPPEDEQAFRPAELLRSLSAPGSTLREE